MFRRCALAVVALATTCLSLVGVSSPAQAAGAQPFTFLAPGFTQELYATGLPFAVGVAFAPNGDPVMANGGFYRADSQTSVMMNGSSVHPVTSTSASLGIGLANSADGGVYSYSGGGIVKIDPATGAVLAGSGACSSGLGIALDPQTHNIVYTGCDSTIRFVAPDFSSQGTFSTQTVGADGITFDATGNFLFTSSGGGVKVLDRNNNLVQSITLASGCCTDGMAFHAASPKFVVSNNTDGTMTRFDFPGDDYTKPPTQTTFASGGSRGDLTQVGQDGCLYLSQQNTRFADGTVSGAGSLVRICPGFVPPVPVMTVLNAAPSVARVSVAKGLEATLTLSATLTTDKGIAVPGQTVMFSAGATAVCSAVTDSDGRAACAGIVDGVAPSVLSLGYTATFAGSSPYLPSSSSGPLAVILDTRLF